MRICGFRGDSFQFRQTILYWKVALLKSQKVKCLLVEARARNAFLDLLSLQELSATKRWTADLLGDLLRLAQIHHPMSSLRHALIMCRYLCKSRAGIFVGI